MHCKSGCCRAATVLLLCGLTSGLLANASATAEAVREQMSGHIIDLDPADLAQRRWQPPVAFGSDAVRGSCCG